MGLISTAVGILVGSAVADAVNLLNPTTVVIGGKLAEADEQVFAAVREVVYRKATPVASRHLEIVLTELGHMAGVISAPGSKYGHWTNDELPATPDAWLDGAKSHLGSWWPLWDEWVTPFDLCRVSPRSLGDGRLAPIGDAPGSYVRVRSDD